MISHPRGRGFRTRSRLAREERWRASGKIETESVDAGDHRSADRGTKREISATSV